MTQSLAEALIRTKAYIQTHGWTPGCWGRTEQGKLALPEEAYKVSLYGALSACTDDVEQYRAGQMALRRALTADGEKLLYVTDWEDARDRKLDEVLALLDKATEQILFAVDVV